jgi:MoaA/NifB/PqqE/SkfB family radical SAM enzyme
MKKPIVLDKVRTFLRAIKKNNGQIGAAPKAVIINYNNTCNFRCEFCYSYDDQKKYRHTQLSLETISDFMDQAHTLGFYDLTLYGGELLIDAEQLYRLIQCVKPERFEISFITNGYLLTQEIAYKLAELGVDCVGVSLSSLDAEEHDRTRKVKGSHAKALKAMEYIDNAGMLVWPQAIAGHHNVTSPELEAFLKYTTERGYLTFFNLASPNGSWHDNKDIMVDENDMEYLQSFRKKYKCNMEFWNPYDVKKECILGCNTVNRLYLTPLGDVFPCSYIPISLGNILKQSLKDIMDYAFTIKWFRNYYPGCISGQCKEFRERFLTGEFYIFNPLIAKYIFSGDVYKNDTPPPPPTHTHRMRTK